MSKELPKKSSSKVSKKSLAYDHLKIEKKWQKDWEKKKIYKTKEDPKKEKYYILDMFPYPSGEGLHVGHPKGYIATDIVSRMKRMQGFNVLHPMGFDAFGLPAEQYAIKTKTNPAIAVAKNVARYKKQLEILGFDYDWSREINTTDPKFYKWTQWIFLQLYKKGLAKESYEAINWCPVDKTGLANEDVENGRCERCGALVEKRLMKQWVLKITDYADRLLTDLDAVDKDGKLILDWPVSIKEAQKNWIGRSEGAEIDFKIASDAIPQPIKVFTTRPDTIFGVTYVVLAPEHPIVQLLKENTSNKDHVEEYIAKAKSKTEIDRTDATKEKTGVELKGIKAINPANNEEVPIWIADYVLADYGTGAVMAVPAHDERDFAFAKKHKLSIRQVISPEFGIKKENEERRDGGCGIVFDPKTQKYAAGMHENGFLRLFSGGVDTNEDIKEGILREVREESGLYDYEHVEEIGTAFAHFYAPLKKLNRVASATSLLVILKSTSLQETKLEEHEKFSLKWIAAEELLVNWKADNAQNDHDHWIWFLNQAVGRAIELGYDTTSDPKTFRTSPYINNGVLVHSGQFDGKQNSEVMKEITEFAKGKWVTKYKLRDWVFSRQRYWGEPFPILHGEDGEIIPIAEKDLPVILPKVTHYEPTDTGESPLANIKSWVNVKIGKGKNAKTYKRETNTMPQWAGSSWYYLRFMDPDNKKEMVNEKKEKYWNEVDLYVGGAEHATRHLIYARFWHKFLYDIGVVSTTEPFKKLQSVGLIMAEDGRKMSKRWGNVVNPDDMVETFGADAMRLYEMFMGPFDQAIGWSTNGIVGTRRFVERLWKLKDKVNDEDKTEDSKTETIIQKTIKKVTEDIATLRFNTAVSQMMIAVNELEKLESIKRIHYETLLKLLSPFAPHMTEELWYNLAHHHSIHLEKWPEYDESKVKDEKATIAIQINGKVRDTIKVSKDESEEKVKELAMNSTLIKKWLEGKTIKNIIYVKNRIISIVID